MDQSEEAGPITFPDRLHICPSGPARGFHRASGLANEPMGLPTRLVCAGITTARWLGGQLDFFFVEFAQFESHLESLLTGNPQSGTQDTHHSQPASSACVFIHCLSARIRSQSLFSGDSILKLAFPSSVPPDREPVREPRLSGGSPCRCLGQLK